MEYKNIILTPKETFLYFRSPENQKLKNYPMEMQEKHGKNLKKFTSKHRGFQYKKSQKNQLKASSGTLNNR